ncbi:MAG: hypothetical protein DME21_11835 [Verrucomicrobia bacterium]|nr:MAG: hypothetical protein DME21_11835 [Verrucomicrobiota bacterium]
MKEGLQRASENSAECGTDHWPVPSVESPTGAGGSPVPPLLPTLFQSWFGAAALALIILLQSGDPVRAADSLVWRTDKNQVDADIESWPLSEVLESISSATDWQIYVEPDTEYTVTTRFQNLKPPEALRRLLGELNFALLPQTNGPVKLFIYRNSVHEATQLVQVARKARPEAASKAIANELIVRLKPGAKESIDALAKRLGAKVVGRLDGLNAYRLQFDNAAAAQNARAELGNDSDVAAIENNFTIAQPGNLQPLAASSSLPPALKPDVSPSSDKIIVALIDTAVQRQGSVAKDFLQPPISLYDDYQPPSDKITHGTAIVETLLDGVAQAARDCGDNDGTVPVSFLDIDVFGPNENTTTFNIAQGVYAALTNHANIVNINTPVTTPTYPAADPGVIAVTAGDPRGDIASYANRGSFVQAMASGMNVLHYGGQTWLGTGTSFSSAKVSGWAAGSMAGCGSTPSQLPALTLKRWAMPPSTQP